ncbi:MAG: hypothetical protein PHO35_07700 [Candidatus Cloacimonetes bacterium]|nr:hypothetical protein [Candidatus Cloacimonadota bacterium]MDD4806649.1 hypothetical protein [Candidatus Cloacimonadota bacterium]
MKKIVFCLLLLTLSLSLFATPSAKSLFFTDSYMLRASGVEANYWNPALLNANGPTDIWLPILNYGIQLTNNALDLDTYNFFVTRDTLDADDKERLLKNVDGSLAFGLDANVSLFGITMGNTALSAAAHVYGKGKLSEDFMRLALYGNTEDEYTFSRSSNNASAISYVDITYGIGDLKVPFIPEDWPQIKAGASASLLTGAFSMDTREFNINFVNNSDVGANLDSELLLRTGKIGAGFKGMFGLFSEITPWLDAGLTVDNIAGFIKWGVESKNHRFYATADSVFVTDLEEDLFDYDNFEEDTDSYTTQLGTELRLATMYKHRFFNLSADFVQGFSESTVSSKVGRLSLGASLMPLPVLPISLGISLPNSKNPLKVSYGIGLKVMKADFNVAVQSFDSLIPGYNSKGISFGIATKIGF